MAENRFAKYGAPNRGVVASMPGAGPKPPAGYQSVGPGTVAPLQGGPQDLARIAEEERLKAAIAASRDQQSANHRFGLSLQEDAIKRSRDKERSSGMTPQDEATIGALRDAHNNALKTRRDYLDVARMLDRGRVTPDNVGALKTFTPEEGSGLWGTLKNKIGRKFIDQQTRDDFNSLTSLQSKRVMDAQVEQKGPQTEADAFRLQLGEVSPYKSKQANVDIMKRGLADGTLANKKLGFMQRWVNNFGALNRVNRRGQTADEAWSDVVRAVYSVRDKPSATAKASDAPVRIKGEADYAALPSGATYIAPDGSKRTKR